MFFSKQTTHRKVISSNLSLKQYQFLKPESKRMQTEGDTSPSRISEMIRNILSKKSSSNTRVCHNDQIYQKVAMEEGKIFAKKKFSSQGNLNDHIYFTQRVNKAQASKQCSTNCTQQDKIQQSQMVNTPKKLLSLSQFKEKLSVFKQLDIEPTAKKKKEDEIQEEDCGKVELSFIQLILILIENKN